MPKAHVVEKVKKVLFNAEGGLRSGWRLLMFVGIFEALGYFVNWAVTNALHPRQRPFLDPVSVIQEELLSLVQVLIATAIMAKIEHRGFSTYGIPVRRPFRREFWVGVAWGLAVTSLVVGLIAALGGYRIVGLAIHGVLLGYFLGLWIIANLLIGFVEEMIFRAYILRTLTEGIGFWPAAVLLSAGFGAMHYFFKPHERWEDFAATALLGLFVCLSLRRTGSLAFAIGFHAGFDFAFIYIWSGQNAGEFAIGRLLETRWQGPDWLTGGLLGPEASWIMLAVMLPIFAAFARLYPQQRFPESS